MNGLLLTLVKRTLVEKNKVTVVKKMKKFGKNILSHLNAKTKIGLGINTPADIQDFAVNQYKEVLALKEQIDKRAESKLSENPTIEVIYNWTDVDAKQKKE